MSPAVKCRRAPPNRPEGAVVRLAGRKAECGLTRGRTPRRLYLTDPSITLALKIGSRGPVRGLPRKVQNSELSVAPRADRRCAIGKRANELAIKREGEGSMTPDLKYLAYTGILT